MLEEIFKPQLEEIERGLICAMGEPGLEGLKPLWQSMRYSLLSGGKRFRPLLSLLTAQSLRKPAAQAMPIAVAVELVHTYSLIHDDLPSLDNDDLRRGQPTNHKVYGEAMALLAGDALLTAAFGVVASAEGSSASAVAEVVADLALAAGPRGMVGGQVMDILTGTAKAEAISMAQLQKIHELKTGALIAVSVTGAAKLCGAEPAQLLALEKYGQALGFAFQLADDIQDHSEHQPEKVSYTALLGLEKTKALLSETSTQALAALSPFGVEAEPLRKLIQFNRSRI